MTAASRALPVVELPLPETAWITPSNINPWRGARKSGARWTNDQLRMMALAGIDPETAEAITVRSAVTDRDMWMPRGAARHVFVFECPVLKRRADGKVLVISPAGFRKWVYADGSISRVRAQ